MSRCQLFGFAFLLLLFIVGFPIGIIGIIEINSRHTLVNCDYRVLTNLITHPNYYRPVIEVTAGNIVRTIDYYPVPYGNNFALATCYLYSCDGVNCPLIKLDKADSMENFFIFLVSVSIICLAASVIGIITWWRGSRDGQTYEEAQSYQ